MAIALDNTASVSGSGISSSFTVSGQSRVLVAIVYNLSTQTDPTGTYNGIALTKLSGSTVSGTRVTILYLDAPDTGANNLSISNSSDILRAFIISVTGSSGVVQNATTATGSGAASASVTSGSGDMIIAGFNLSPGGGSTSGTGGLVLDQNTTNIVGGHLQAATTTVGASGTGGTYIMGAASIVGGAQISPSASMSPSASRSPSASSSSSQSPSASSSASQSPSGSTSPSASLSPSSSVSSSASKSQSPSASSSVSQSPSSSVSPSASSSSSASASASPETFVIDTRITTTVTLDPRASSPTMSIDTRTAGTFNIDTRYR